MPSRSMTCWGSWVDHRLAPSTEYTGWPGTPRPTCFRLAPPSPSKDRCCGRWPETNIQIGTGALPRFKRQSSYRAIAIAEVRLRSESCRRFPVDQEIVGMLCLYPPCARTSAGKSFRLCVTMTCACTFTATAITWTSSASGREPNAASSFSYPSTTQSGTQGT